MSAEQRENPDAMLRQSAFPADIDLDDGQSSTRSDVSGTAVWAATPCQPSARSRLKAALISERWVKAWGKLPSCSPVGPISSANRPRWLA